MTEPRHQFTDFVRQFCHYVIFVREVLACLLALLLLFGFVISRVEDLPLMDAIYFAFITGLSIGYGDITPKTGIGCVVSVATGITGMILTGMTVAIATRALADSSRAHMHKET